MKRLIFSALGVILTFTWIIYTAPPKQENIRPEGGLIKTINRSGATSLNKITQPIYKNLEPDKSKERENLLVKSGSKASTRSGKENE